MSYVLYKKEVMATFDYDLQRMMRWAILKAAKNHREVEVIEQWRIMRACRKACDSLVDEDFSAQDEKNLTRAQWERLDEELLKKFVDDAMEASRRLYKDGILEFTGK